MTLLMSGCALWRPGSGVPDFGGVELPADSLAAIVDRRALTLGSVRGSGDLVVRSPAFPRGRKLDVSLVARRPSDLRVRGRFGLLASVFDFVADADSLRLYLPRESAVAVLPAGRARPLSLVASDELVQALLPATLDGPTTGGRESFERTEEGYAWTRVEVDSSGDSHRRRWLFEPARLKLIRVTADDRVAGRTTRAIVDYAGHEWTGHAWFPTVVRLQLPDQGESLDLLFRSFEPNPTLEPGVFRLRTRPGTRRIPPEELNDDFLMEAPDPR